MSTTVLPELTNAAVLTADGEPFRLGDAWANQTAVLAFLRHFG